MGLLLLKLCTYSQLNSSRSSERELFVPASITEAYHRGAQNLYSSSKFYNDSDLNHIRKMIYLYRKTLLNKLSFLEYYALLGQDSSEINLVKRINTG